MTQPSIPVSVLVERREIDSRWITHEWRIAAVIHAAAAPPAPGTRRHDGFAVTLFRDEAEGYYLNTSTGDPKVFVMWRLEESPESEDGEVAVPKFVTVSYNEAARLMDAQERVDMVAMPEAMRDWLMAYVAENYRPAPKKKRHKVSFLAPADRARL